jgi:hypothetical protein
VLARHLMGLTLACSELLQSDDGIDSDYVNRRSDTKLDIVLLSSVRFVEEYVDNVTGVLNWALSILFRLQTRSA